MTLTDISIIVSIIMSFISTSVVIYDKISTNLTLKSQLQLEKQKSNYAYKLQCYSEFLALFLHTDITGETNLDDYIYQLNKTTAQAKMFCSKKTLPYINNLINQLENKRYSDDGIVSPEFYKAFHSCVKAFREEIILTE